MDTIKEKLHQLDREQLRQIMDTSSEVHRALQELVVQLQQLEKDLDIHSDRVYNSRYKPIYIVARAYMDMCYYEQVSLGFRDLAMENFEESDRRDR